MAVTGTVLWPRTPATRFASCRAEKDIAARAMDRRGPHSPIGRLDQLIGDDRVAAGMQEPNTPTRTHVRSRARSSTNVSLADVRTDSVAWNRPGRTTVQGSHERSTAATACRYRDESERSGGPLAIPPDAHTGHRPNAGHGPVFPVTGHADRDDPTPPMHQPHEMAHLVNSRVRMMEPSGTIVRPRCHERSTAATARRYRHESRRSGRSLATSSDENAGH